MTVDWRRMKYVIPILLYFNIQILRMEKMKVKNSGIDLCTLDILYRFFIRGSVINRNILMACPY